MRPQLLIAAALAAVVLLAVVFGIARRFDPALSAALASRDDSLGDISIRLVNSKVISRLRGVPEWSVNAARMDFHQAEGAALGGFRVADFAGITHGVLYRKGEPEGRFQADRATMDRSLNLFDVNGDIRLRTAGGDAVSSDHLVWSPRDDFARFPAGVRGVIRGYRLTAPQVLFALRRRVLECPQGAEIARGPETLRAASMVWNVGVGRIECPGMVSGARPGMTFVGQNATIDQQKRTFHIARATLTMTTQAAEAAGPVLR